MKVNVLLALYWHLQLFKDFTFLIVSAKRWLLSPWKDSLNCRTSSWFLYASHEKCGGIGFGCHDGLFLLWKTPWINLVIWRSLGMYIYIYNYMYIYIYFYNMYDKYDIWHMYLPKPCGRSKPKYLSAHNRWLGFPESVFIFHKPIPMGNGMVEERILVVNICYNLPHSFQTSRTMPAMLLHGRWKISSLPWMIIRHSGASRHAALSEIIHSFIRWY